MPEAGLLRDISSLGLGAVITVIVIYWKRADDMRYQKALENLTQQSIEVIKVNTSAMNAVEMAVRSMSELIALSAQLKELKKELDAYTNRYKKGM